MKRGFPARASPGFLSALAVGAVAVVAVLAALDSLRDRGLEPLPVELRGELIYSDAQCRRHGVRLPDLGRRDFLTVGCGVFTRRDNLGVKNGGVAWFAYPVAGGTTTLLERQAFQAQLGRHFRIRAVAWLGGTRFTALVGGANELVTVWDGPSLGRIHPGDGVTELRASPFGRFFAAIGAGRVRAFDRRGEELWTREGRAVAWSPDERFTAVPGEHELEIVRARAGTVVARVPVTARDVDWRAAG